MISTQFPTFLLIPIFQIRPLQGARFLYTIPGPYLIPSSDLEPFVRHRKTHYVATSNTLLFMLSNSGFWSLIAHASSSTMRHEYAFVAHIFVAGPHADQCPPIHAASWHCQQQ